MKKRVILETPMLRKHFFSILLCFQAMLVCAQTFDITRVQRVGDNVVITYNLLDSASNRTYTVNIYSSADDYASPLKSITGDVGLQVPAGTKLKITWNAKADLGAEFSGDVAFELRGKVYVPFIRLSEHNDFKKVRRKKLYHINWAGGSPSSLFNFDLYRGDQLVTSYPNIPNTGHYAIRFEGVKTAKDYKLRISDSKNKDEAVYTAPFAIKARIPLIVKVVPVLVAGVIVYILLPGEATPEEIIDPPIPE